MYIFSMYYKYIDGCFEKLPGLHLLYFLPDVISLDTASLLVDLRFFQVWAKYISY